MTDNLEPETTPNERRIPVQFLVGFLAGVLVMAWLSFFDTTIWPVS